MLSLESIDYFLLQSINGYAGHKDFIDQIVLGIQKNHIIKSVPLMMIWWGLWFHRKRDLERNRPYLLGTILVSFVAIIVGRMLANTLPFRARPLHNPEIETILPFGMSAGVLEDWSSMPSDHAVFFFALAACIFVIHRTAGVLLIIHAALIVSLPRIYTGVHFPSDLVVGAVVGVLVAVVSLKPAAMAMKKYRVVQLERDYGHVFYPVVFFITFQAASMFDSLRSGLSVLSKLLF